MKRSWIATLAVAAVAAFALKIILAITTYGTNDVLFWEANLRKIKEAGGIALYRQGAQLYRGLTLYHTEPFNQPPLIILIIMFWGRLADFTGEPLRFWLRLSSSVADVGSLCLVGKILGASGKRIQPLGLLLIALSPTSIMISGFHGNTDSIMIMFLLLSIYLATTGNHIRLSGLAFGMAMSIKVVPLLFLPAIILYLFTRRQRIEFLLFAGGVFLAGSLPYVLEDPLLLVRKVLAYSPAPADWGFTGMARMLGLVRGRIGPIPRVLALAVVALASFRLHRLVRKPSLFSQCGFVAMLILFVAPAFGVQYLAWLVPWIALDVGGTLFCYIASGAFLIAFYTVWAGGFPWYLANVLDFRNLQGSGLQVIRILEMICWISVGSAALNLYRSMVRSDPYSHEDHSEARPASAGAWIVPPVA